MLEYRKSHREYMKLVPINSRTLDGRTAFHAAFMQASGTDATAPPRQDKPHIYTETLPSQLSRHHGCQHPDQVHA